MSPPLKPFGQTDGAPFGGRCLGSRRPKAPAKPSPDNEEERRRKSLPGLWLSLFLVSALSACLGASAFFLCLCVSLFVPVSLLSAFPLLFAFPAFYGSVSACSKWNVGVLL